MSDEYVSEVEFKSLNDDVDGSKRLSGSFLAGVRLFLFFFAVGVVQFLWSGGVGAFALSICFLSTFTVAAFVSDFAGDYVDGTGFERGDEVAGILPNLYLSAMNGEWDSWDTKLLAGVLAAVFFLYRFGTFTPVF